MLHGIKILVAEDNPLNQKIAKLTLQKQNAIVVTALDGQEAIELIKENDFDVILMDLQMPCMDGYTATAYIRNELHKSIPIIAVTASVSDDELNQSLVSGMDAYICKPFETNNLCELILDLVKKQAQLYTI